VYKTQFYALFTSTSFVKTLQIVSIVFPFRQILPTKVLSCTFDGKLKNVPSATFLFCFIQA